MTKQQSGVYEIRNLVNGKRYVGSAADLRKRFKNHRTDLNCGRHGNLHLRRAWAKYGTSSFTFEVLEVCQPNDLLRREQFWIDHYDAYRSGYNRRPRAESNLGIKWPEETRRKMGLAHIGNKNGLGYRHSAEAKARMSETRKGRRHTEDAKSRMSVAQRALNKHNGPETRAKLSAATKEQFRILGNPFAGHTHTAETREQIRIKAIKRQSSPEFRKKMSDAVRGFRHSEDTKSRMRLSHLGKKHSIDHKAALFAAVHRGTDGRFYRVGVASV